MIAKPLNIETEPSEDRKAATNRPARREFLSRWPTGITKTWFAILVAIGVGALVESNAAAQDSQPSLVACDPAKVVTAQACAKCHANEVRVWQSTPHATSFETLSRTSEAKEICRKLGVRSPKRSERCAVCHFTSQVNESGKLRVVAGVSCESCHGAAADWLDVHNDYGGPQTTRDQETESHRQMRLENATRLGMRNTRNLYLIASQCYQCHTIPDEELVNRGGHRATNDAFELVAWSQGSIRHNFLRTDGQSNAALDQEQLRVMYVVGLLADLESSTRAVARATEKSTFGTAVARRAVRAAVKLYELQQQIHDPHVQSALEAFAQAELKTGHAAALVPIADSIRQAGISFAETADGSRLAAVDSSLPRPDQYR